jgi:threonine 3-dehydrogenase
MKELGMREGFDVGLEMSGAAAALQAVVQRMAHGGRIAILGLSATQSGIGWSHYITNMLAIRGVHEREMFETCYWMSVLVESGLNLAPGHHPPLRCR